MLISFQSFWVDQGDGLVLFATCSLLVPFLFVNILGLAMHMTTRIVKLYKLEIHYSVWKTQ